MSNEAKRDGEGKSANDAPATPYAPPAIVWEQQFVGLQALSDPCRTQIPPPGYCQGNLFDPGNGS